MNKIHWKQDSKTTYVFFFIRCLKLGVFSLCIVIHISSFDESNIPLLKSEFDRWEVVSLWSHCFWFGICYLTFDMVGTFSGWGGWAGCLQRKKLRPKWSRRSGMEWHKRVLENQIYIWLELFCIPQKTVGWPVNEILDHAALYARSWVSSLFCRSKGSSNAPDTRIPKQRKWWQLRNLRRNFFEGLMFGHKLWNLYCGLKLNAISAELWFPRTSETPMMWCGANLDFARSGLIDLRKSATHHPSGQQVFLIFFLVKLRSDESTTTWIPCSLRSLESWLIFQQLLQLFNWWNFHMISRFLTKNTKITQITSLKRSH